MTDARFAQSKPHRRRAGAIVMAFAVALLALRPVESARAEESKKSGAEWVRDGNRLLQADSPEKALEAYDRAQLALPDSAKVSYNRGLALYQLGRYADAETALQNALRPDAIELEPDIKYSLGRCAQAAAMAGDGNIETALNHAKRAVEFYQDALELRPDDADTKKNLSIAESQQKFFEKLIELAKQQQEQDPQQNQDPSDDDKQEKKEEDQKREDQEGEGQSADQDQSSQESSDENKDQQSDAGSENASDDQQQSESESTESENESEQQKDGEQQSEQENPSEAQEGKQDQRSDEQLGDDQLEDASQQDGENSDIKNVDMKDEAEGENADASEQDEAESLKAAATQMATSMPAESPMEMAQRISLEKAQRLLQTARDKEARRREAFRRARLRNMGRTKVEKDW